MGIWRMQRGLEVAEITHLSLELIVNYPIIISSGRLGFLSRCSFLLSHPNTVKFISRVYLQQNMLLHRFLHKSSKYPQLKKTLFHKISTFSNFHIFSKWSVTSDSMSSVNFYARLFKMWIFLKMWILWKMLIFWKIWTFLKIVNSIFLNIHFLQKISIF